MSNRILSTIVDILVPLGPLIRRYEGTHRFEGWHHIILRGVLPTFFFYWIFSLIPFVGTLLYGLVLIPLSASIHIDTKKVRNRKDRTCVYLLYYVVILIGFGGIWGFVGHTVLAESVAQSIGWNSGSPFQTELAFYHLGLGVAGILSLWYGGGMIVALVISKSIFWYGAAFVHIQDAVLHANYAIGNVGPVLVADIVYPTLFLYLLIMWLKN